MQKMQIVDNLNRKNGYESQKAPQKFKEVYSSGKRQDSPGVFGFEETRGVGIGAIRQNL